MSKTERFRSFLGIFLSLLKLSISMMLGRKVFGGDALSRLTAAVAHSEVLEIAAFSSLALLPFFAARFRLVVEGVETIMIQLTRMAEKLRGEFSVSAHVLTQSRALMTSLTQSFLYFWAINLFVNAIPDAFEVDVPKLFRFLDANGDGTLEAEEIETFVYDFTSRLLNAKVQAELVAFLMKVKRPPLGWSTRSLAGVDPRNMMEAYWKVTSRAAGWFRLVDLFVEGFLHLSILYIWMNAVGVDVRTVTALGGVGGLAVGLAAQQVVGNGVSALIILATAPCREGDKVEVGPDDLRLTGTIKEIGWNATCLGTDTGRDIYVPNATMLNSPLVVLEHADKGSNAALSLVQSRTLRVNIISARGIRKADVIGQSDPYVVCVASGSHRTVEESRFQTAVQPMTLTPVWDESFDFPRYQEGESLAFLVYDRDFASSHDLLGVYTLNSSQFYPNGFEGELKLSEAGEGHDAYLLVRVTVMTAHTDV